MPFPPDETSPVTSWLKAPRPAGFAPKVIIVHATRGANTQANQYAATKSWFKSTGNGSAAQGWGGCATIVISHEGQLCRFMDELKEVPRYSAGFGDFSPPNGWSADDWGLSMELAQSAAQEAYDPRTIDRAALQAATWCQRYGIEPVHLPAQDQRGATPARTGIIGHDELANGRRLGKTDPGAQFPWQQFMSKVSAYMSGQTPPNEEDDMFTVLAYGKLEGQVTGPDYVFDLKQLGLPGGKRCKLQVWTQAQNIVDGVDQGIAFYHGLSDPNNRDAGRVFAPYGVVEIIASADGQCYVAPGLTFDVSPLGWFS